MVDGMLRCYTAVVELDDPESALHAMAILDHHADLHPAVVQARPGRPELTLTLPAENLGHAVRTTLGLVRATGHRPVHLSVTIAEDLDIADRPPGSRIDHPPGGDRRSSRPPDGHRA